jgi:hypothetical protein
MVSLMTKPELRAQARNLRKQGLSVNEITALLKVSKSSVSLWVRDVELSDDQREVLRERGRFFDDRNVGAKANRARSKEDRITFQEAGRAKAREFRPLHLAGCMLFWAEGAKQRNGVYFVNGDPNMMRLFARFLREEMGIKDDEFALRIHCHTNDPDEMRRIEQYWADLLGLPLSCIRKTYVIKGESSKPHRMKNGVCDLRVHSTELVQHIYGAIQEYGGFENPEWLF